MQVSTGIIVAAQEGRFLLADDDGRSRRFVLAPDAGVEAQDLPDLVRSGCRIEIAWEKVAGRRDGAARRFRQIAPS